LVRVDQSFSFSYILGTRWFFSGGRCNSPYVISLEMIVGIKNAGTSMEERSLVGVHVG
jgi:hypothetical protein